MGSVNVRLSTVKTYCKLAAQAGTLDRIEYAMIRAVEGYTHSEGRNLDRERIAQGQATRRGHKEATPITLTQAQADRLKNRHDDDPQGRRDRLIVALFLSLGLRCGELAGLRADDLDLDAGKLTLFREKVDKVQTHCLIGGAMEAAWAYLAADCTPSQGPLFVGSTRGGALTNEPMSRRAIAKRVHYLGRKAGIEGLAPHDLRHYWATCAAHSGTPLDRLMDAGGWSSPAMPMRYVQAVKIANEGVRLV